MEGRVMIMAGGTGGHVFPAIAVADELRSRGADIFWLGTPNSFESRVVPEHGYELEWINIKGIRGNGLLGWLLAPARLVHAMYQAFSVMQRRAPDLVIGMGGFASGPGGLVARLLARPLIIHEQNAVPGLTNRWLAKIADRVLEAFPGSFDSRHKAVVTGNPVRSEIAEIPAPEERMAKHDGRLRLLILGGSQGAQVLNETVPQAIAGLDSEVRPQVRHQAGKNKVEVTREGYQTAGVEAVVTDFVSDMAEVYQWADLVICRSGALTVAELAAAGVASLLVPYPYAVDDHQTLNGQYLSDSGAAVLVPQDLFTPDFLRQTLLELIQNRTRIVQMSEIARGLALSDATVRVADLCETLLTHEVQG